MPFTWVLYLKRLMMASQILKKKMNNWVEKYASTNRDSRLVSFHFILEL
jgi:hypothetical protein